MPDKFESSKTIRIMKACCVEYSVIDNTWIWCYQNIREALKQAKNILMKMGAGEHLVVGMSYCDQTPTGEIMPLLPDDSDLVIGDKVYSEYDPVVLDIETAQLCDWPFGTPNRIFGDIE